MTKGCGMAAYFNQEKKEGSFWDTGRKTNVNVTHWVILNDFRRGLFVGLIVEANNIYF